MKNLMTYCLLLTAIMLIEFSSAYAKLSLNGQYKPKFEFKDGYKHLKTDFTDPAALVSQRTRLILDYSNSALTSRISVQDVRVWGDEVMNKNTPSIGLHEAWVDLKLDSLFQIKLGRQELFYDDGRLLGNSDWSQTGRSHDAVLGKYETSDWKLHFGGAFNQNSKGDFGTNYTLDNYKGLGLLWFENKINSSMRFSLLGLTDIYQKNDSVNIDYGRLTLGGNYYLNSDNIDMQATAYYQTGKTTKSQDISAYLLSLQAYYKMEDFKLGAGVDYLSGNSVTTDTTKYNSFNTLYPSAHKFYGSMDYFTNIPAHTKNGGLMDIYVKLNYKLSKKWSASLDYHNFSLANPIINPSTGQETETALASEFDLSLVHKFSDDVKFQFGYSYLVPNDALKVVQSVPNGENSQWLYLLVSVTPDFFSSK